MRRITGMKRALAALLTLAMLLSAVTVVGASTVGTTVGEGSNSFEQYDTGAVLDLNTDAHNTIVVSEDIAGKTGSKTAKVTTNLYSGNDRAQMLVKDDAATQIAVQEGKDYVIKFSVYIPNDAPDYKFNYWLAAADNEDMFSASNPKNNYKIAEVSLADQPTKGAWSEITVRINDCAHSGKLRLGLCGHTYAKVSFYIDDIYVREMTSTPVGEGSWDFETEAVGDKLALNDNEYFAATVTAADAKSGSQSLLIHGSQTAGTERPQVTVKTSAGGQITVTQGEDYKGSFWVKIPTGTVTPSGASVTKINYWLTATEKTTAYKYNTDDRQQLTDETVFSQNAYPIAQGDWVKVSFEITDCKVSGNLRLGITGNNTGAHEFYLDDFTIEKTSVTVTEVYEGTNSFEKYTTGAELDLNTDVHNTIVVSEDIAGKTGSKTAKVTTDRYSGNDRAQMLVKDEDGNQIVLKQGKDYVIKFSVFIPNDAPSYKLSYWLAAADNEEIFSSSNPKNDYKISEITAAEQPAKGAWTEITVNIGECERDGKLRLGICGHTYAKVSFYIDDISVDEIEPYEANEGTLTFESYGVGTELDINSNNPNKIVVSDAVTGVSGTKVAAVTSDNPSGNSRPQMLVKTDEGRQLRVYKGRNYEFKFHVYIPEGAAEYNLNYWIAAANNERPFGSDNAKNDYVLAEVTNASRPIAGQWAEITLTVTDAPYGGKLRFGITGYTTKEHTFYIDDITFTETTPAEAMDEVQSFEDYMRGDKLSLNTDAASVTVTDEDVHTGSKAAKIVTLGNAVNTVPQMMLTDYIGDPITVEAGKKYNLSFFVMIPYEAAYDLQCWLTAADGDTPYSDTNPRANVVMDTTVVPATDRGGWQLVTLTIDSCAASGALRLGISGSTDEAHTFYIDDIFIRERTTLPGDPDAMNFETQPVGEHIELNSGTSCTVTISDEQSYSGNQSACVDSHDKSGNFRPQFNVTDADGNLIKLKKGDDCYVSFMVYLPTTGNEAMALNYWLTVVPEDKADKLFNGVDFTKDDHVVHESHLGEENLPERGVWTKISIPVLDCPRDGVVRIGITHGRSAAITSLIYIDDIKVEPPRYITVKFDTNGSEDVFDDVVMLADSLLPIDPVPYLDGSDFMGWYTSKEFKKSDYFDIYSTPVTGEDGSTFTLYARWRKWDEEAADLVIRDDEEEYVTEYYTEKVWVGDQNVPDPWDTGDRLTREDAAPIVTTPDEAQPDEGGIPPWLIVIIIVAAVVIVGGGAAIAAILLKKKKES